MTWCFWKFDGYFFLIEKGVNFVFLFVKFRFFTCNLFGVAALGTFRWFRCFSLTVD